MNWKQILMMDMGTLLRGGKPPRGDRSKRSWRGPVYVPALFCYFVTTLIPFLMPAAFLVLWWTEGFLFYRRRHLVHVLSVLEGMFRCNVPLPEGLRYASLDAPNRRIASVLVALSDDMNQGATLSEAMQPRKRFFPPGMAELVRAAELSGGLPHTLASLIRDTEDSDVYGEHERNWTFYYGMYALTAMSAGLFAITYVLPTFRVIFADFGVAWPPLLSWLPFHPVVVGWTAIALIASVTVAYFGFTIYSATVSYPRNIASGRFGAVLRPVPYLRNLFFKHNLGLAAALAGQALKGGATLDEALQEASDAPIHPTFQRLLGALRTRVLQGRTLSDAMEETGGGLPASFTSLVRLGERSGMLADSFEQVGIIYRSDVRRMSFMLLETVAPFGILLFGTLVLSLSFSLFGSLAMIADTFSQSV